MEAMICKQCGAPLKGNKCEHCGTEYHEQIIHNHYTTVINNFGMPLKEKVKEEPKREIPVSKPDVLTDADTVMIEKEGKEDIKEKACFALVYLMTAFTIAKVIWIFVIH